MALIIIGGGVVGLSVAYGLLKKGQDVIVLDGADDDFRASRGNFGLVWVQGKGADCVEYSKWSRRSAALWADFAREIEDLTGFDLMLRQVGGMEYFTNEIELEEQITKLESLRDASGGDYPYEALDQNELRERVPEIGPKVVGATYCPEDGHVNPLFLLKALSSAVRKKGGDIQTGVKVVDVLGGDGEFQVILDDGSQLRGEKIVLSAGLGAMELGPKLGFSAPIRPQQGQILITEKLPEFLHYPSGTLRQVNEGGIQIGASKAELGLDDAEDNQTISALARHAVDVFPHLEKVKMVRSWAALRIMSPDGLPIYQQSDTHPGATFITCHSGVTLAAAHAGLLPDWILGKTPAYDLSTFSERRFDV
ncbi:NAD(P)/FAD-dependent oxidoreductase [Kiloniella sp.]|uniref:NAD(P)/FAD-dependent oxidoreductase n=1 Tax=Kiloniella sp. TaxID=1938587 RepID=UPI003B019A65